ncbi:hypothetical protein [Aureibaculum luteum]|uniref:hypothetical protein n=1 Tax=Aureibaculum luteum TaxID=1548456 RepID=UPI0013009FB8|nr:hypothetical protein [Aureibaculum luteum]
MKSTLIFILCIILFVSCNDNKLNISAIISKDLFLSELKGDVKECKISKTHVNRGNTTTLSERISFNKKGHITDKFIETSSKVSNYNHQNYYSNNLRDSTIVLDSEDAIINKYLYFYTIENKLTSFININYENQIRDTVKIEYSKNAVKVISTSHNKTMLFDNESSLIKVENKFNNQSVSLLFSNDKSTSEKQTDGFKEMSTYIYDDNGNWTKKTTVFNVKTDNKIEYTRDIQYYNE